MIESLVNSISRQVPWSAYCRRRESLRAQFSSAEIDADQLHIDRFRHAAVVFPEYLEELEVVAGQLPLAQGHVLEFGVFRGKSINHIAALLPESELWGFDSFEGLPEDWIRTRAGGKYSAGHFALPELPEVRDNVRLVKGFFDETLPQWTGQHAGPVRLLHIDADLYSSAVTILYQLNSMIVPGTVIVFDELCDWTDSGKFDNWPECEWKALGEWMRDHQRSIRILSRTRDWSAAVVVSR